MADTQPLVVETPFEPQILCERERFLLTPSEGDSKTDTYGDVMFLL